MNWEFNPRVSVIIHDVDRARILLCKKDGLSFWMLPGGRIELGEKATEAVRREVLEELGAEVEAVELLWIIENLFHHDDRGFHEYGLYFVCDVGSAFQERPEFRGAEQDLLFEWVAKDSLDKFDLRPALLRAELKNLDKGIRYIEAGGA
jgi:ADP-ribose pyrophosphatase YjhB (NUDIX family)